MEFIKKNYDKIILSVVLLGLIGLLVFMPFVIVNRPDCRWRTCVTKSFRKVKPLPPLDLSRQNAVLTG